MKPQFESNPFVNHSKSSKKGVRFVVALCLGLTMWAWMGVDAQVGAQTPPAKKIVMKFGHLQATDSAIHMGAVKFAELMALNCSILSINIYCMITFQSLLARDLRKINWTRFLEMSIFGLSTSASET